MKRVLITISSILLFSFFLGCEQKSKTYHHTIITFGTLVDITIYGVEEKIAEQAFANLEKDFEYLHSTWTPYEASSLSRMNSLIPTGKKFSAGPAIIPLYQDSLKIAENTDNLYNPAIGKLIKLWQFHKSDEPDIKPPEEHLIKKLVAQNPKISDLKMDGIKMYSTNPAVELNFGAFAKGSSIDMSMEYLKSIGISNAIINTGGDLKAIGKHGDKPWQIGIRHPRKNEIIAGIKINNEEAVFTSGDYERFFIHNGKRYHHILDPRTGYPAEGTQSVTVIHHDSGLADAAATALFIAGPNHWYEMAKKLGIKQVMLIDKDGKIHISPEMKQRLMFNNVNETTLIVSPPL